MQESTLNAWVEFSGRLEAVERVDFRSRVAGYCVLMEKQATALLDELTLNATVAARPRRTAAAAAPTELSKKPTSLLKPAGFEAASSSCWFWFTGLRPK